MNLQIRRMLMQNFTCHTRTELVLPERGVVLITGSNGAGKSSAMEVPAVACWGQPLRGKNPWNDGREGLLVLETDRVRITRKRTRAGRLSLSWELLDGTAATEFDSMKKAQAALESVVGSAEMWRKTAVFSSSDAAHLTLATDSERKRLLEAMIGSDRFDPALSACRLELRGSSTVPGSAERSAITRVQAGERVVDTSRLRLDAERQRVAETEASLAAVPVEAPPQVEPPSPTRAKAPVEPPKPPPGPPAPPAPTKAAEPVSGAPLPLPERPSRLLAPLNKAPLPPQPVSPVLRVPSPPEWAPEEKVEVARLSGLQGDASQQVQHLATQIAALATSGVRERAELAGLQQQQRLLASGHCPTCEQATDKVLDSLRERISRAEIGVREAIARADTERQDLQGQMEEMQEVLNDLRKSESDARAKADAAAQARVQRVRDENTHAQAAHAREVEVWRVRCADAQAVVITAHAAWEQTCREQDAAWQKVLETHAAREAERKAAWSREHDAWKAAEREKEIGWQRECATWRAAEADRQRAWQEAVTLWRRTCAEQEEAFHTATLAWRAAHQAWESAERDRKANAILRGQLASRLAMARAAKDQCEEDLQAADAALSASRTRVGVLEACEQVLGLRGVRATVLGKALAGINAAANAWMARLPFEDGRRLQIMLSPITERKDGGESDAISLLVRKNDDPPREYLACSGGERRRVDIALLLGLSDVAAAAHGVANTQTLWMDEIFDALDPAGIGGVCALLDGLAKERAVVVITHDPGLVERIHPARHFHFSGTGVMRPAA